MINVFGDVKRTALPTKEGVGGQSYLDNLLALQIGHGSTSMKVNKNGLGLGGKSPEVSPFFVDMNGNVVASSIDLGGAYVETGGSAADVNAGVVTISGGKITAGSLTVTNAEIVSLAASKITSQIVNAQIASIEYAKITNVYVTNAQIESLSASKLTAGTIDANVATIINLSATSIVTGTLTVGGSGAPTAILLRRDASGADGSGSGSTYLRWDGGSRIWVDTSNRIGINSIGSPMYIYVNSTQKIIIPSSGQTTMKGGVYADGNVNVINTLRVHEQIKTDYDNIEFSSGYKLSVRDMGLTFYKSGSNRAGIYWGNGSRFEVDASGKWFQINGNAKEAIVPTYKGYKALYCMESPEVWFMDFYKKGEHEDILFNDVTVGNRIFQMCVDENGQEWVQVWRRRKGHEQRRFEDRSEIEFNQNERFLRMSRV